MKAFFKTVFASLLALILFTVICVFFVIGLITSAASVEKPHIGSNAVLVLDLSTEFKEQSKNNLPFNGLLKPGDDEAPSLYDMVRMIKHARSDSSIKGIYILCNDNINGFGASEELRKALLDFKTAKKFVIAYGETISQKGYYVGNTADKIYCHPQGGLDWQGFAVNLMFLKGTLDKLEIQPQIFYAGKFKSATEPLRETQMTDANRLQTAVWLGNLYDHFLQAASIARKMDTAQLRALALKGSIQTAYDAVSNGLLDGMKYDDELKKELLVKLKLSERDKINFVTFHDYAKSEDYKQHEGGERIAIIYADGDIISGSSNNEGQVSSDAFRVLIRRLRLDEDIKGIVLRVNSPGGSALASDVIWREIMLARKEKPVIVSMGDVAASGGYYISCNADSVFANANTITGSIGVFSVVPNLQSFYKNKLGITFDGVKTAPYADMGSSDRPLNETEKRFFQASTDSIYHTFKTRVAEGRKKDTAYISSIAQGRVWTGSHGLEVGLVDRIGTLQDAVECAARMAKLKEYQVKEFPEKKTWFEQLMNSYNRSVKANMIKEELGEEQFRVFQELKKVKQMVGAPQMRLPFSMTIN
jgi:protease-4